METLRDRALLERRLGRLRSGQASHVPAPHAVPAAGLRPFAAPPSGAPPRVPAFGERGDPSRRRERLERLAGALGGRVEHGPHGGVVVVESRVPYVGSLDGLSALPYAIDPSGPIVLLDTETTGLGTAAGTLPFLVGLGVPNGTHFVVRQLCLADHPDEEAFLAVLAASIPPGAWLVTYNGRTFDWPLLVARYRLRRQDAPGHAGHLDLLPVARQLWKHRLSDARLASVEAGVAGIRRPTDLPGWLIPARYLDYLRTGRGALLGDVLEHNRQDVVSLGMLLLVLAERLASAGGRRTAHPGDLAALGRAYLRRGRLAEALECVELGLERMGTPPWYRRLPELEERLAADRARLLGRMGDRDGAAAAWLALALEGGRLAPLAWIQVAKHREHVTRDPPGALAAADRAGGLAARAGFGASPLTWVEQDLARRIPRLRRRMLRGINPPRRGAG